jgi:predicted MPP superfamily phosphohydrolase
MLALACFGLLPLAYGSWFVANGPSLFDAHGRWRMPWPWLPYLVVCWSVAPAGIVWWFRCRMLHRPPAALRSDRRRRASLSSGPSPSGPQEQEHHFLVRLPGNEILDLEITERTLEVPALPASLNGLTIVHLSDFHFTGRVGKSYFHEVVAWCNRMQADLIAVTGDLVDRAECVDWIPETLGRLSAAYGAYFVLGNHDRRVDVRRLRQTLVDSGLVDLGGRWIEIRVDGEPVILAGNELPWIPPAADMTGAPPPSSAGGPPRILLSHSPDQIDWAQAHDFDLLLAGHTHGGQFRLPLIGAVLTPSRLGVKYASGVFCAPPTLMHVTRGVSGEFPVRLNCPPELAALTLRAVPREKSPRRNPAAERRP